MVYSHVAMRIIKQVISMVQNNGIKLWEKGTCSKMLTNSTIMPQYMKEVMGKDKSD